MLETLAHDTDIWVVFSFVIFMFILIKGAKGAMTNVVDARIDKIKRELEEAENLHTEAQELLAQYQRKHASAVQESEKIIENAEVYANKIRKQAKKEIKQNLERREEQLVERIERMKENAIADIQVHAANLAIEAAQGILEKNIDKKLDKAIVEDSIKAIKSAA